MAKTNTGSDNVDMTPRLKTYGIAAAQAFGEPLIVPPGKTLHIEAKEGPGVVALRPRGIDDVKRWIGVSDEIVRKRKGKRTKVTAKALAAKNLTMDSRAMHDIATEYVLGDSARLAAHRSALDQLVSSATIFGVFLRSDLEVYGVLEIDPSVRVIFARHVRIWNTGSIRFRGTGKIDAFSIRGGKRRWHLDLDSVFPAIGTVVKDEV